MATKRLKKGKGIKVRSVHFDGDGEIVSAFMDTRTNTRAYEVRIGPAHFVYLRRTDFELVDTIIKFDTLVKLRQTDL